MSMVGFPLLLIPLAIYNIIVFMMPGVSLSEALVTVPLPSGAAWPVTLSDMLVVLGILMVLLEVIKGARPGAKFLTDHLLSLIVFGAALAEFLLWPRFANSTFFLLVLLACTDFLTSVALRVRRRPAVTEASRGAQRVPVEDRREPAHADEGSWSPRHEPASHAPAEPKFTHAEPQASESHAVAPAQHETPLAESKPASSEPQPPETAH